MKFCKSIAAAAILLAVSTAGGVETFMDVHEFGRKGILWDFQSRKFTDHRSTDWSHVLTDFDTRCSITEATLTIEGKGIENICLALDGDGFYERTDSVSVWFMGQNLGQLTGDTTTFDLLNYDHLIEPVTNASAELTFQNDLLPFNGRKGQYQVDLDWKDAVFLKSSTLSITCEPIAAPATVPAPSAVALAGIGTMLVGFLRNRKRME